MQPLKHRSKACLGSDQVGALETYFGLIASCAVNHWNGTNMQINTRQDSVHLNLLNTQISTRQKSAAAVLFLEGIISKHLTCK